MRPNLTEARDEEAALAHLHHENLTDGLPVIIPTVRRGDEMILASGYEGDLVLCVAGPSQAAATVEAVAINAVMAGCLPEYFPVVLAAVKAICDEQFDLTELQVTTHAVTPLLIVNGPARHQCGLASGFGTFGLGQRSNATIGRALRLFMMNIGGGRPGVSDMALFGHPALAAAGYSRSRIQEELVDRARHPRGLLRQFNPGMIGPGDDDELIPTRDPILLFVARRRRLCDGMSEFGHRSSCPQHGHQGNRAEPHV